MGIKKRFVLLLSGIASIILAGCDPSSSYNVLMENNLDKEIQVTVIINYNISGWGFWKVGDNNETFIQPNEIVCINKTSILGAQDGVDIYEPEDYFGTFRIQKGDSRPVIITTKRSQWGFRSSPKNHLGTYSISVDEDLMATGQPVDE